MLRAGLDNAHSMLCAIQRTLATAQVSSRPMTRILVVADAPWVRNEVHAALTEPDTTIVDIDDPTQTAARVLSDDIDLVIVDLQVGSMGGMAVTRAVRDHLVLAGHAPVPVVILLDRSADGFLAKRAGAAAWVVKPFTSQQLSAAMRIAIPGDDEPDTAPTPDHDDESEATSAPTLPDAMEAAGAIEEPR